MPDSMKPAGAADVTKLADLIRDIKLTMLTTVCPDGSLRSRPMATQKAPFDGQSLWFMADADSAKMFEIDRDHHVNLAYADAGSNTYVSVSGLASVSRDRAKIHELWHPVLKAWFPNGPDDPNIGLIRVDVSAAEYWDAPSNKLVQLVGFVKATATGKRYHPGDHQKLDLQHT